MEEKNGRETAPSHCHNSPFKHEKPDLLNSPDMSSLNKERGKEILPPQNFAKR